MSTKRAVVHVRQRGATSTTVPTAPSVGEALPISPFSHGQKVRVSRSGRLYFGADYILSGLIVSAGAGTGTTEFTVYIGDAPALSGSLAPSDTFKLIPGNFSVTSEQFSWVDVTAAGGHTVLTIQWAGRRKV